ncbi:MAG: CheR family methyltransferase [Candidatus Poribacteria bacterium]
MAFTFFFRDKQTLDCIQEYVVPNIVNKRYIRIWDAGCANGSEPYSIAILIRERTGTFIFRNVNILASDINKNFGKIISEGEYSKEETGRIPEFIFKTYFSPSKKRDGYFAISDEIKRSVSFINHDLLSLVPPRTGFCLIVCKNVLLHFSQEDQIKIIDMFYNALEYGGYFVTEQTQKLPKEFSDKFQRVVSNAQLFMKI